ncbi:MAG: class I adenylate-forming enzyme family protein [Xanthomonadales bacterium]|nr:class I adenylate-forming enzyme family protein [Xanthomonadales bacterium]
METPDQNPIPRLGRLDEYLDWHAARRPTEAAAEENVCGVDWASLRTLVDATAAALQECRIQSGQRVAFMGPPGLSYWITFLACQRAGGVWVGLNPQYTARELTHVLTDSKPALVLAAGASAAISDPANLQSACQSLGLGPVQLGDSIDEIADRIGITSTVPRSADSVARSLGESGVALVVYTSGSTGAPKGALITQTGLIENGWWLARRLGLNPHRTLANLPVNHIGCVGDVCSTALISGGALVFMPKFDPRAAVEVIRDRQVEWIPQVPAQFQLMVDRGGLGAEDLGQVRCITWGGAPMPRGLIKKLSGWVPDLFNSYGLTECSGTIALTQPGDGLDVLADTVGAPVAPGLVAVTDEAGRPCAQDECGEIRIRGKHLFHGYLDNPSATRQTLTEDGWLRTGDLGAMDGHGNLRLLGRTHEMFKSGGYNVYPREIESVIEDLPEVSLCAVVSVPDDLWQEVGVAVVQADPSRVSPQDIETHCRQFLARYKVPKRFVVRNELPLLPVGKVDKSRLTDEVQKIDDAT